MKPSDVLYWINNYKPTAIKEADLKKILVNFEKRVITEIVMPHYLSDGLLNINYKGEAASIDPQQQEAGDYFWDGEKFLFVLAPAINDNDVVSGKLTAYADYLFTHNNVNTEQNLIVPEPYSEIYRYWMDSQIDFAQSEYDKCQNSAAMFNQKWDEFARWYTRNCKPISKGFKYI